VTADRNRCWRVARHPHPGEPLSAELFDWGEEAVAEPADGEFLVRTICLAPGPAQRGYLDKDQGRLLESVAVGDVMRGRGVGQIVASRNPEYSEGEIFLGSLGWQDYSVQRPRGKEFVFSTKKIMRPILPLSTQLGVLGQAGVTAYFGLLEVGALRKGDSVLVTAGAGGVGSVAGQLASINGADITVGTTSSNEKCAWMCDELGYDAAINYHTEAIDERLNELFPKGIDVIFDNVGGEILNTALTHLAFHARVVICGFIATDYTIEPPIGPINYRHLLYKRARMEGFVSFDYWDRYAAAEQALAGWYRNGQLVNSEDVDEGLEKMPDAVASLFTGGNRGVKICRVAPDPERLPGE
jgi:NADPH-dependent curcumin reductase CurA